MTRVSFVAAVAGVLVAGAARGQEPPALPADGYELFRGVLDFYGFQPVGDVADIRRADYPNTCVVLIHYPRQTITSRRVAEILNAGGTALIAVESEGPLDDYLPGRPDVRILPFRVQNDDTNYRGQPNYPLVRPAGAPSELFPADEVLVARLPTLLRLGERGSRDLRPLAAFPPGSPLVGGGRRPPQNLGTPLFAAGGAGPPETPYRCLVLSSPSVFSNRLLVGLDGPGGQTDNLEFAARVAKFLKPAGVERPKCLFIESGRVRDKFDQLGLYESDEKPPMPPLPSPLDPVVQAKLTDLVNAAIDKVQGDNKFNAKLAGGPTNREKFVKFMQVLAGVFAALAAVWMVRRVWAGRHDPDRPPVPTDTGRVAGSGEPGSFTRRREELLQSGDYTRPVREYLDDLFARQGLPADEYRHPRSLPPVAVAGGDARAIRSHLRILWEAAYGPGVVTYSRWKELEPMIAAVQRAAGDGRWRFAAGGAG